jgi:hypothetical protein
MVFTEEDKVAVKFLRENKRYGAKRLLAEFPPRQWSLGGLKKLIRKIDETGSIKRSTGAGRPRSARRNDNIERIEQLSFIPLFLLLYGHQTARTNPVDYKIWSVMEEKVYKKPIKDIIELRASIMTA